MINGIEELRRRGKVFLQFSPIQSTPSSIKTTMKEDKVQRLYTGSLGSIGC